MAEALKHSSVLFAEEDGSPMVFSLRPCSEKKTLRPLIEHGGGQLTSVWTQKAIKLAIPGESNASPEGSVSIRFIEDCVKENKLLDIASYRMNNRKAHNTSGQIDIDDMEPAHVILKTTARDRKGRKKFTLAEDKNIIKFLIEERRFTEMKGNSVWKDMEMMKTTNHTSQSMKDRFKKHILPNIRSYAIPKSWISALTGVTSDARTSPVKSTSTFSGFSPLFRSPECMNSSPKRNHFPVPLQSTPKKNLSGADIQERNDLSACRTRSSADNSKETSQSNQSKGRTTSETDQSDDDDFDKELFRMADKDEETHKSRTKKNETDGTTRISTNKEASGTVQDADKTETAGSQSLRKSARISQNNNDANFRLSGSEDKSAEASSSVRKSPLQETRKQHENETENLKSNRSKQKDNLTESAESSSSPSITRKRKLTRLQFSAEEKSTDDSSPVRTSPPKEARKQRENGTENLTSNTSKQKDNISGNVEPPSSPTISRKRKLTRLQLRTEEKSTDDSSPVRNSRPKEARNQRENESENLTSNTSKQKDNFSGGVEPSSSPTINRKRKLTRLQLKETKSSSEQQPSLCQKQSQSNGSPSKEVDVNLSLRRSQREKRAKDDAGVSDKDESQVTGLCNKALTNFVMDIDHAGSSQESQGSADEDTGLETDLENSAGADEVKKHCEIVKRLCSKFGRTPGDVLSALWANSGSLRNTIHWFQHGVDISGLPAWTEEDDSLLESTRSDDINLLRKKYGAQRVDQRAAFLEDSSLK